MDSLYDKLISYTKEDYYPMHMPGHKRNTQLMKLINPYDIDITEIEGFDNLHQPQGVLEQLSQHLSSLYGAGKSFPLVNGSTAGILAGISAAVSRGDEVLIARNSHKSVYHAAILMGLKPVYCYPPVIPPISINGGISARDIDEALINNNRIKLVVITSPTYEGVVSDIKEIAKAVHRHGATLLVDEAHGAHFGLHRSFPESAVRLGADIVIQSLHKTLPAFTQTAVLHSNREALNQGIQKYLSIYQSSSPSYLLMAGMDLCIKLLENQGEYLFETYIKRLQNLYRALGQLKVLKIVEREIVGEAGVFDLDPSKVTISVRNTKQNGHQLQELLRDKYHIETEMAAPDYVLAMTSLCDTEEGFQRLCRAILEIDSTLTEAEPATLSAVEEIRGIRPVQVLLPQSAMEQKTEIRKLRDCTGRISAAFISLFPPGAPLLVPGERLEQELIAYIERVKKVGITVTGLTGSRQDEIEVVCG